MVLVAAALAAGIGAGYAMSLPVGFWAALAIAALVVAAVTFARPHLHLLTALAVGVAIAALGATHVRMKFHSVPADHIVTYTSGHRTLATVRGRIVSAPQVVENNSALAGYSKPPQTVFILSADAIKAGDGWAKASGLLRVTVNEPAPRLSAGQRVTAAGWIGRFSPPANPGQFDWARAARRDGLWVQLSVPVADGVEVSSADALSSPARAMWRLRAGARQHLHSAGGGDDGDLLTALILGERSPALRKLNETMVRAGVAHFLSISGLHLGIFLGFVYLTCRLMMLSPRRAATAVLVVLACYVLLAEPRAPLLRSALMATAVCIATIARRKVSHLNALAVAAVVLLAADPMQLLSPGFQLSFAIVAGLMVFAEPVKRWMFSRFILRRGLMVFRNDQRAGRWVYYSLAGWLMTAAAMSLTAYMVAAPLVALHFGIFTPYAPLLSVLLLPIVAAVLVVGHVSLALAGVLPGLAYSVGQVAGGLAGGMAWAIGWLDYLPGLSYALRPVTVAWVGLCYAVMLLVLSARRLRYGRAAAALLAVVLVTVTINTQRTAPPPELAELNVLAVGKGQCVLLRTPSGRTFLLDAGTQSGYDVAQRVLLPFVRARRLPGPSAAFISHANTDHYNALPALLGHGRPALLRPRQLTSVYLNDYFGLANDHAGGALSQQMLADLTGAGVEIIRLRAGDRVQLDDRTHVEAIWPGPDMPADMSVNDRSLVLRITCDDRSVIVAGDIKQDAMTALLAGDVSLLAADAIILPHHGGWSPALPALVAAVDPAVVLRSSSRPAPIPDSQVTRREFFESLRQQRRYYTTAEHGWLQLTFGRGKCEVTTMRSATTR